MKNYFIIFCFLCLACFTYSQNLINDTLQKDTSQIVIINSFVDTTNTDTIPIVNTYEIDNSENQPGKPLMDTINEKNNEKSNSNPNAKELQNLNTEINTPYILLIDSINTFTPIAIENNPLEEKTKVTNNEHDNFDNDTLSDLSYPPIPTSVTPDTINVTQGNSPQLINDSIKINLNNPSSSNETHENKITKLGEHAPDVNDPNYTRKKEEWLKKYPQEYNAVNTQSYKNDEMDEYNLRHYNLEQILKNDSVQYNIEIENIKQFDPDFYNEHLKRIQNK